MKTQRWRFTVLFIGTALLALLVLSRRTWSVEAQIQSAATCNKSFEVVSQWGGTRISNVIYLPTIAKGLQE
jgi:hypothetical protein